jgi:hypothetical protein
MLLLQNFFLLYRFQNKQKSNERYYFEKFRIHILTLGSVSESGSESEKIFRIHNTDLWEQEVDKFYKSSTPLFYNKNGCFKNCIGGFFRNDFKELKYVGGP